MQEYEKRILQCVLAEKITPMDLKYWPFFHLLKPEFIPQIHMVVIYGKIYLLSFIAFSCYVISRDTVVSCVEFISLARRAPCLFTRDGKLRPAQINSYYYITITAERIELLLGLIDSLCLNYVVKVSLFLLYEL